MDRSIPMLLIGLVFGGGLGFAIAAGSGVSFDRHDHSDPAQHGAGTRGAGHDHAEVLNLPPDGSIPTLAIEVKPDPSAGWNLHIETSNFSFSPEHASRDHVPGEGHAHIYVNGVKLGRVYGPWVHLDGLPAGQVTLKVTLNANDHRLLAVGDQPLSATQVIEN